MGVTLLFLSLISLIHLPSLLRSFVLCFLRSFLASPFFPASCLLIWKRQFKANWNIFGFSARVVSTHRTLSQGEVWGLVGLGRGPGGVQVYILRMPSLFARFFPCFLPSLPSLPPSLPCFLPSWFPSLFSFTSFLWTSSKLLNTTEIDQIGATKHNIKIHLSPSKMHKYLARNRFASNQPPSNQHKCKAPWNNVISWERYDGTPSKSKYIKITVLMCFTEVRLVR